MAGIRVVSAGLLTTVQDEGRWGWQAYGVPVSGPMDPRSHRIANALVGNPRTAAVLEVTLVGPALRFDERCAVAIGGARFDVKVNGVPAPYETAFVVPAGGELRFGGRQSGARAYLAVAGGIAVPPVFGSRATHVASRMGGLEGRPLRAGDVLPVGDSGAASAGRTGAVEYVAPGRGFAFGSVPPVLRILPGPHADAADETMMEHLQAAQYTVRPESDRIGFRLSGTSVALKAFEAMISEPTCTGMLQVPPSGEPILLMADRQTSGGYPAVATVIGADLHIAGQLAPGDSVRFERCSAEQAAHALIAEERALMRLEARAAS